MGRTQFEIPKVKDIMTRKVIALTPDADLLDALHCFNHYRISSVPIISQDGKQEIIGILTEADCLGKMGNKVFFDEIKVINVEEAMSTEVIAVNENTDLFVLEDLLCRNSIRHAPVVDGQNHLVGFVARRDALKAMGELMNQLLKRSSDKTKIKELDLVAKYKLALKAKLDS